ncbi:MAG TPA: hydroxymethylbilane synthase [Solirubrobacteraceae bacterium]|jgi:hydroxymethylbilane synthase|nr:hydroxymethylbilane synthase [Solirubrobacteraceae bacterium]
MRLGTRASALALAQAQLVAQRLEAEQGAGAVEIVPILTRGDRESAAVDDSAGALTGDGPQGEPPPGEDKSRWVSELERALAAGEIDLAVHSAKDVPGELGDGLALLAAPPRAAVADVLCGAGGLDELPSGARIGTSSLRRIAQLCAFRDDLQPVSMHGNVDTRLRKLADGEFDAIVLARAGLARLGREQAVSAVLDPARFVPAPGQGTLALEGRRGDAAVGEAAAAIGDADTMSCLLAERALARSLDASCDTPLGALAQVDGENEMLLRAWIGLPDGSAWIADELSGAAGDPQALAQALAARLEAAGARALLDAAANAARTR